MLRLVIMWSLNVSLSSNVTPRYLIFGFHSIRWLSIVRGWVGFFLFLEMQIRFVLGSLVFIFHFCSHCCVFLKAVFNLFDKFGIDLEVSIIAVSSAYIERCAVGDDGVGISEVNIMYSNGESGEPWGTPACICLFVDR